MALPPEFWEEEPKPLVTNLMNLIGLPSMQARFDQILGRRLRDYADSANLPTLDPQTPPSLDPQTPPALDPQTPPSLDPQTPPSLDPQTPPSLGPI